MMQKLSVYLNDNTYQKLGDIKRVLGHGDELKLSTSQVIAYCILCTWERELVASLTEFTDKERHVVEKYTTCRNDDSSGGGEQ